MDKGATSRDRVANIVNRPVPAVVLCICVLLLSGWLGAWFSTSGLAPAQLEVDYLAIAAERVPSAMILTNPEQMSLFLSYVDEMAEGVGNLELSPEWLLSSFVDVHTAAAASDTAVTAFRCGYETHSIKITGSSPSQEAAVLFAQHMADSTYFQNVALTDWSKGGAFTVSCTF